MGRSAKMIGALAALSPLVVAVPAAVGAVVYESTQTPVLLRSIEEEIASQVPGESLHVGDSLTIDLGAIFEEADTLTYSLHIQNGSVADVKIVEHALVIRMKKPGTTIVNLTASKPNETSVLHERFRLTAAVPDTLDSNSDGMIRVDELVKYMNEHPGKEKEDYLHLLSTVAPYIPPLNHSPVTSDSTTTVSVAKNGSILLDMNEYFSDEDGDWLSYSVRGLPSHGVNASVWLEGDGYLRITGLSYGSPVAFSVRGSDDHPDLPGTATHQFQVNVLNTVAPEIPAQIAVEDVPFTFTVPANLFVDPDAGDQLTYSATLVGEEALPEWLTFDPYTLTFSGTPTNWDVGTLFIQLTATDNHEASESLVFVLDVQPVNDPPFASPSLLSFSATEDTAYLGQVTTVTDIDGDSLTYSVDQDASHGTVMVTNDSTGTFTYTPHADYNGSDSFVIRAEDGHGGSVTVTFHVTVTPVNDAPTASSGSMIYATEDTVYAGQVDTISDIDGDTLLYTIDQEPMHGYLEITDPFTGAYTYTPYLNYNGSDSFVIRATDPHEESAVTTILVSIAAVNDAPTAGSSGVVSATEDVLYIGQITTITDVDGDALTYSLEEQASHGTVTITNASKGEYTYMPDANYNGADSFVIKAQDIHGAAVSATIMLYVAGTNDAPVLNGELTNQEAIEGVAFSYQVPEGIFTDVDAEDELSYSATLSSGSALPSWLVFTPEDRLFSGTPTNGQDGTYSIRVTATDGEGLSAFADFQLTVQPVNDAPTLVHSIADKAVTEGSLFSFVVPSNTFTDIDPGDSLTYSAKLANGDSLPAWLAFNPVAKKLEGTPSYGDAGNYQIKIVATDTGGLTAHAEFNLHVNAIPRVRDPIPTQYGEENEPFTFALPASTMFTDDTPNLLTYTVSLQNGDPLPSWLELDEDLRLSGTPGDYDYGTFAIRVTATDPYNATASTDFTIVIQPVNDAPRKGPDIPDQTATEDVAFQFVLPSGSFFDIDPDDTLSYSASRVHEGVESPLPSWLSFNTSSLTFSGTPREGDDETFDIRVTATDHSSASVVSDFTLTVLAVNDAPYVNESVPILDQTLTQESEFEFTIPANAFLDPDSSTLTYSAALTNGQLLSTLPWISFNPLTRTFTGRPNNDSVGTHSIRVTATDDQGAYGSDDFVITVNNINDAPVINPANQIGVDNNKVLNVRPNQTAIIDLHDLFTDPDGDILTYNATGSVIGFGTVNLISGILHMNGLFSSGNYQNNYNLMAYDSSGASATHSIKATVVSTVYGDLKDQTILMDPGAGTTIDLSNYFDIGGDGAWSFTANTSNAHVQATIAGSMLTLKGMSHGVSTVEIRFNDGHGAVISDSMTITSGIPVQAPEAIYLEADTWNGVYGGYVHLSNMFNPGSGPNQVKEFRIVSVDGRVEVGFGEEEELNDWFDNYSSSAFSLRLQANTSLNTVIKVEGKNSIGQIRRLDIPLRTNQPPIYTYSGDGLVVDVGVPFILDASQYFTDLDGDALESLNVMVSGSMGLSFIEVSPSVLSGLAADIGNYSLQLKVEDGFEYSAGEGWLGISVVDKRFAFATGHQTASANIAGYLSGMMGPVTVDFSGSERIGEAQVVGNSLILTLKESAPGGVEKQYIYLEDSAGQIRVLFLYLEVENQVELAFPAVLTEATINLSPYMSGLSESTVTATVYGEIGEYEMVHDVSFSYPVLTFHKNTDHNQRTGNYLVELSDGILPPRLVRVQLQIPVDETIIFPLFQTAGSIDISAYTAGMNHPSATVVENYLIRDVDLTENGILTLEAVSYGEEGEPPRMEGGAVRISVVLDDGTIRRRLVLFVSIPRTWFPG